MVFSNDTFQNRIYFLSSVLNQIEKTHQVVAILTEWNENTSNLKW